MSFFSAYQTQDGHLVNDFQTISKQYLAKWFALDFLASFPFYLIANSQIFHGHHLSRLPRLLKILRVMRLIKILRAYRIQKFFEFIQYSPRINPSIIRVLKLSLIAASFAHFTACTFYLIAIPTSTDEITWINDPASQRGIIMDKEPLHKYSLAFYFVVESSKFISIIFFFVN
ncbi:hypothetical protein RFI_35694 [Reticulomyxa filosa]|nr:hypothetical protein RFI_35694 [Reticulomyxa filosa]|eukprot:ETO01745.1 hypothetical protein RFI_35694 [Reticulomyxa filosa]